jgi:hypothetical protein
MCKEILNLKIQKQNTTYFFNIFKKVLFVSITTSSLLFFSGCGSDCDISGGGSSGGSDEDSGINLIQRTVTAIDGYIKVATITDKNGEKAIYKDSGKYIFKTIPEYPLKLTGGRLLETNFPFDINLTLNDDNKTTPIIMSPITTFIDNNITLHAYLIAKGGFKGDTYDSLVNFQADYIENNDTNLAKLSQMLYAILRDGNLTNTFKAKFDENSTDGNLTHLFNIAYESIDSSSLEDVDKLRTKSFLNSALSYEGNASSMEANPKIRAYKSNLKERIDENLSITSINFIEDEAFDSNDMHNYEYGTVVSPYTERVWLDRNLGAKFVCPEKNGVDSNGTSVEPCHGYIYQWGRGNDGHQHQKSLEAKKSVSYGVRDYSNLGLTDGSKSGDINATGFANKFIVSKRAGARDWINRPAVDSENNVVFDIDSNGSIRHALWSKIDGSSICPRGFRVPTADEIIAEMREDNGSAVTNTDQAFNNFLKLPANGGRWSDITGENIAGEGMVTTLWSSSQADENQSIAFGYGTFEGVHYKGQKEFGRAAGAGVRCIKHLNTD